MPGEDLEALSSGPQKCVERGRQHYRYRSSGDADGLRVLLAIGRVQVARHGLMSRRPATDKVLPGGCHSSRCARRGASRSVYQLIVGSGQTPGFIQRPHPRSTPDAHRLGVSLPGSSEMGSFTDPGDVVRLRSRLESGMRTRRAHATLKSDLKSAERRGVGEGPQPTRRVLVRAAAKSVPIHPLPWGLRGGGDYLSTARGLERFFKCMN